MFRVCAAKRYEARQADGKSNFVKGGKRKKKKENKKREENGSTD
jgi:hypothetical protein